MKVKIHKDPNVPVTELEQSAFCGTDVSKPVALTEEFKSGVRWQRIPVKYTNMEAADLGAAIARQRKEFGDKLVILGHHYQRDEIIKFADHRGDSLKLAQFAANNTMAEYIIFCGVHFMAETACILSSSNQSVYLPNITAGCSMSDMANIDDVTDCYDDLASFSAGKRVVPVTYMNSAASIKALCGKNGGIVCTSSNALSALKWAFERGDQVLFLPDQHLGRNTGAKMGISLDEMKVWNPFKPLGGLAPDDIHRAKIILWKGHCSVHVRFSTDQIAEARRRFPDINVIVHPECTREVVQAADLSGSTETICQAIATAPPGSKWAVGTEISLVNRLSQENKDKLIFCLDPIVCPCSTMYRIHPAYLLWIMDELLEGRHTNQIQVDPQVNHHARVALSRMLEEI